MHIIPSYHEKTFREFETEVSACIKELEPYKDRFDSLACCGISGLLVAPTVALFLNKGVTVVRKPEEKSHSPYKMEGFVNNRVLLFDDCVVSGATMRSMAEQLKQCTIVGYFTYHRRILVLDTPNRFWKDTF